jgi:pilus assembly protein Flp/PilA
VNTDLNVHAPEHGRRPNEVRPEGAGPNRPGGETGQGLVEYAIIIFLVAIVVIAILLLLGPQIGAVFSSIYATI